jgi:hypothetical protein
MWKKSKKEEKRRRGIRMNKMLGEFKNDFWECSLKNKNKTSQE